MSDAWFHMVEIPPPQAIVELEDSEARHALRSRRLKLGDRITLFNGAGLTASAELVHGGERARSAAVRIVDHAMNPRPRPIVELASCLPKGDRQSVLLGMATQLGMHAFRPLTTERAIARPSAGFRDRFNRICIEACKQCHRPFLPELRELRTALKFVSSGIQTANEKALVLMAHPGGESLARLPLAEHVPVTIMIGPEGGFTDEEVDAVRQAGGRLASLGDHPLRIETAGVAALASIMLRPSG